MSSRFGFSQVFFILIIILAIVDGPDKAFADPNFINVPQTQLVAPFTVDSLGKRLKVSELRPIFIKDRVWFLGGGKLKFIDLNTDLKVQNFRSVQFEQGSFLLKVSEEEIAVVTRKEEKNSVLLFNTKQPNVAPKEIGTKLIKKLKVGGQVFIEPVTINQIFRFKEFLVFNGGQNNFAFSKDQGKSWKFLVGNMDNDGCLGGPILMSLNEVYSGGECPMDSAFLARYNLISTQNGLNVTDEKFIFTNSQLGNRRVGSLGETASYKWAGSEGAFLLTLNNGKTWGISIQHPVSENPDDMAPHNDFSPGFGVDNNNYPYYRGAIETKDFLISYGENHSPESQMIAAVARENLTPNTQPNLIEWMNVTSQFIDSKKETIQDFHLLKETAAGSEILLIISTIPPASGLVTYELRKVLLKKSSL